MAGQALTDNARRIRPLLAVCTGYSASMSPLSVNEFALQNRRILDLDTAAVRGD